HPAQLDARLVQPGLAQQKEEHHLLDFSLTDQNGEQVTLSTAQGKIILADFFFTTCTSICPKMSMQMARVQAAFKDDDRVLLLSHSVTPEIDSVPVLKAYGELHGVDARRWRLLTGDRKRIYALARTSWFAVMDEGDGGPDDFVHTENFILADPDGRLRGFYDGTSAKEVDRAIADMHRLLEEVEAQR
ncbi:MAG TPA: SCO family protein, partial [Flavobacteriales bacterium]